MRNQKGFTLIEIAIVLVIIGLLLGGILKGRAFIDSAKTKNLVKQAESLTAAIYGYQDKYSYFPGDDPNATSRWAGTGNGNGNGQITEWARANQHLALAELITGDYNGTSDTIVHKYGGNTYIYYANIRAHGNGNLIRFDNLPASAAEALDKSLDDGDPTTGSVRINRGNYSNPDRIVPQTAFYF